MAKSIDIQRKLKEQLDLLDELGEININIDELLRNLKSEVNKYISKNQKNIQNLLEVERGLQRLIGQQHASLGTLEDNLKSVFEIISEIGKFGKTIERINKHADKVNQTLASVNMDAIKDFDVNVVIDFFGAMNKNFSLNKMNRLSKYINSISLDGLQIVTDDLQKFDINIITTFLGTISRLFGENRLNKVVSKISKTSGTEDFEIVLMYLKDMDKFLSDSISYLNKMTNRIKNFVNKTNVNAGGAPSKVGGGSGGSNGGGMFGRLMFAGAGIAFLSQQAPALTRVLGLIFLIGKGFIEAGSRIGRGFKMMFAELPEGVSRTTMVMKGLVGVLGGLALAGGIIIGIFVMGIRRLLQGIEEAQRMRLQAAQGAGLNELAFMGTGAAGQATPGGILARFAGAGEERMISARAQMLARMGGNERLGGMSNVQAKGMAVMSQLFGLTLDKTAQLRDIMENIMGMNFEEKSISFINKYGVLANKVVKDISDNTREYVLYGAESFERLSVLANKLSINTKDAIKVIEKFSTVSGAIDTSFNLTLATGKFMNPLTQFMRYAFGDPDKIFEEVIKSVGDISSMNRIQKKYIADTLSMSVDELEVATQRFEKIQQVGEETYNQQYKTLDQIVKSYGFQRLLGGISEILDLIEQEVLRGAFQGALEWIKTNAEQLPVMIDNIVSMIKQLMPIIFRIFGEIGKALLDVIAFIPGSSVTMEQSNRMGRSIDSLVNQMTQFMGGNVENRIVTSPKTIEKSNVFAVDNAVKTTSSLNGNVVGNESTVSKNKTGEVKVIEVKSDVKLDGYKVGEGLTQVALEYAQ